jgi:hypothetical protein
MNLKTRYPLARLPRKTELILALLSEELKASYFFEGLAKVGLDDCSFQPYLGSVILTLMGFDTRPDAVLEFYFNRLAHHTKKLKPGQASIMKRALRLHEDLRQEKKRRENIA